MARVLTVAALLAVAAALCPVVTASADDDFTGSVHIGDGRSLFLNCQGSGTPTVFVIPGLGSYAEVWNVAVAPDDPIRRSPYDLIGQADLAPTPSAAQPTVARTTRVCAYDRPDTRPDGDGRSTSVPQPHAVRDDVDDIVKLLAASGIPTPVVIAAHSYGGLIADLLIRTHPELVSGLVLVDPTSEFLPEVGTDTQNAAFARTTSNPPPDGEAVLIDDAFADIRAAPPLPELPAIVLMADKYPAPADVPRDAYTLDQIHRADELLAEALGTTAVTVAGSGHNVMLYQPQEVARYIVTLVERVRAGAA